MSEQRKVHPEDAQTQPAYDFCGEMMKQMTGQQVQANPCAELISQCFDLKESGDDFLEKMSQMMTTCCGSQEEAGADTHCV